ncbi:C-type mannose receptor 2 [Amphibalanus amphitrite]|uniref:C-type mannose receptor 2 n=1 Tax=Amphibalanus amphitrite TaxID=1232801 RepID=A0A6A4VXJ9_AMPAM|nr:C-type mannose receptor 2 [Amphibalanus amphitrite]
MLLLLVAIAATAPLALAKDRNCSEGFKDLGLEDNRCYFFSIDNSTVANETWTMAFVKCQTFGGDILSVKDPLHFYPMSVLVQQSGADAWTGLFHVGETFSWADESPYNEELNQFIVNKSSSAMYGYISAQDGMFHFTDGDEVMPYICYEDTLIPTETPPTTPTPPNCTEGWQEFDGHCYLFSSEEQVWTTAEHNCSTQDADLVSIHDHDLVTFLLIQAGADIFWTGLHNENTSYAWADGSSTEDIADVVEPMLDTWERGKDCVAINQAPYPKSLVHYDCFATHKYVCYKEFRKSDAYALDYSNKWYAV